MKTLKTLEHAIQVLFDHAVATEHDSPEYRQTLADINLLRNLKSALETSEQE